MLETRLESTSTPEQMTYANSLEIARKAVAEGLVTAILARDLDFSDCIARPSGTFNSEGSLIYEIQDTKGVIHALTVDKEFISHMVPVEERTIN